ncbi:unnamed protein product [Thlaspi arvense]|uniref:Uncharacterized protein n=1 Tax=Thlaspi arvense TaxID=13288 RepID=A0AAU9RS36_THLAR|nr:unnamed protein product [Thlaspi arvense]
MAFSTGGGIATIPLLKGGNKELLVQLKNCSGYGGQSRRQVIKANLREDEAPSPSPSPSSSSSVSTAENTKGGLGIGSPIVVIEAPKMIKTAAAVPCLRANAGLVNPGDVGRYSSLPFPLPLKF